MRWQSVVIRMSAVALAVIALLAWPGMIGCSSPAPEPVAIETVSQEPPPPPEPALHAASDAHLTFFGEFPDQARVPFNARAASPMKQHSFSSEGADFDVDVSPDGKTLVYSSTRNALQPDLYVKGVDAQAVTQITSDPAADVQPCFSPDGQWVAFASNRAGNWDLWLLNLQGGQCTQITHSPQHEVHPSFASDGRRLAYCAFNDRAQSWELWTLSIDQPGSRKMIGAGLFPRWSPRDESIVYQKARQRGGRWFSIWRVDLESGEPKFPTELAASSDMALIQPAWSPDGAWIAYGTARLEAGSDFPEAEAKGTRGDVWIMKADGSSSLQLTEGDGAHFSPAWGTDGCVYFSSRQGGSENIWSVRPLSVGSATGPLTIGPSPAPARPVQAAATR